MLKPPKITKSERNVLAIIAKGHPNRVMTINTPNGTKKVSPLTWDEIQYDANKQFDDFADCIAHLVSCKFIKSATIRVGLIQRIFGKKDTYYFLATNAGRKFLDEYPIELIPEKIELPKKESMSSEDIQQAISIFEISCTESNHGKDDNVQWANDVLDPDIKNEIEIAEQELELMWRQFEKEFGHKGPARNNNECNLRDPVVKRTSVRIIRARDEQLRRRGFPPSEKPKAWSDYYNNGDVGLESAPWEK